MKSIIQSLFIIIAVFVVLETLKGEDAAEKKVYVPKTAQELFDEIGKETVETTMVTQEDINKLLILNNKILEILGTMVQNQKDLFEVESSPPDQVNNTFASYSKAINDLSKELKTLGESLAASTDPVNPKGYNKNAMKMQALQLEILKIKLEMMLLLE